MEGIYWDSESMFKNKGLSVSVALTNEKHSHPTSAATAERQSISQQRDDTMDLTSTMGDSHHVESHEHMTRPREETANKTIAKQRKLRKGTHSCWECKRRKARCVFSTGDDKICVGCRRRGSNCVNQNEGNVESETKDGATNRRLLRIETMLETLLERQGANDTTSAKANDEENPVSSSHLRSKETSHNEKESTRPQRDFSPSSQVQIARKLSPERSSIHRGLSNSLSRTLHDLLPSQEECRKICSSTKFLPCFFQQMLSRDWKTMSASQGLPTLTPNLVAKLPPPDVYPILLAQKMLMLACLAQFISRELSDNELKYRADHMASAAIDVVAKEELCRNAEGLECLMLEATYHANNGDFQGAFSAVRRAMACGQLLGIHRSYPVSVKQLDKSAPPFDSTYMWYRIVSADRLFSLVLGLPQGFSSTSRNQLLALADLDPEQQLERQHSEIASWVLDRNERDIEDMVTTQAIDQALQDAAFILPLSWWMTPALSTLKSRRELFLATTRLVNQVLHFNLINQTHLPYLHRPGPLYAYNKIASVTASREILHRYLILQSSGAIAHSHRTVECFALTAAVTLTLAHIERHWQDTSHSLSILAHTRSSDLAIISQTMTSLSGSSLCTSGPQVLEHLLQIEAEAFLTRTVGSGTIVKGFPDEGPFFELSIPHFGQLRLNSAKICFVRMTDVEDVSVRVKNMEDCVDEGGMPFLGEGDLDAFIGDVGSTSVAGEYSGQGIPFEL